ncbi:DUF3784 domain-containing protein [Robertkochia aurantiaca]|uniref:DUF3784 domain-containing protein n=1 Tax=Robertkochia aurantiaca TaxID=2873700 RepID=UPI001CCFA8A6|nr:DUF3784 domain-containing protein [Robertkochia sp. 3YJGBD-33]
MIFAAAIFILLGILVRYAKMYNLIAGYNSMDEEEKARYDIEAIAHIFGNVMFYMATITILGYGLSLYLDDPRLKLYALIMAIVTGLPYLLIRTNSKKFRKKE